MAPSADRRPLTSSSVAGVDVRSHANPHHPAIADVHPAADGVRPGLDDIRTPAQPLRCGANSLPESEGSGPTRAWVREAMHRASLSQKAFAINCKQGESVISEALGGTRNLPLEWLKPQGKTFWFHFVDVVTDALDLSPAAADDAYAERVGELVTLLLKPRRSA